MGGVMIYSAATPVLRFTKVFFSRCALFIFLVGMGSCRSPLAEICSNELPQFSKQMEAAVLALGPWYSLPASGERRLASEGVSSASEMLEKDRQSWIHWTEKNLKEIQGHLDGLEQEEVERNSLKEFASIANELVIFHGYAQLGDAERMVGLLKQIQQTALKAQRELCSKNSGTP